MKVNCSILLALSALVLAIGCSQGDMPDIGYVEGTVTLDGNPVANALVTFQPEHARPSYGRTDDSGHYELSYTDDAKGATIGAHTVSISTASGGDPDQDIPASKETIPAKYNANTELKADVKAGDNEIDFPLESAGGEIVEESDADEE